MKLKRMMLEAVMAFAATLSLMADMETIGGYTWTYRINDDTAEIYNGGNVAVTPNPTGVLAIPSTLGGKPVTGIGEKAFYNCSGLTSVTLPEGLESVGAYAFGFCSGLESVSIPNSETDIDDRSFYNCRGLTEVTIPQCVCSRSLSSIFPSSYKSIRSIIIVDGVASIESWAFSGCIGLANVTIPDSVTSKFVV